MAHAHTTKMARQAPITHIVLWKWRGHDLAHQRYTHEHVNIMALMLMRNISPAVRYRIVCVTDEPRGIEACETFPLWDDFKGIANYTKAELPSCYRRLKLFDARTQEAMGIAPGDRIVSIDLDAVITGNVDPIIQRPGGFVGWELPGTVHPRVFNGSLFSFDAGNYQFIWDTFNPDKSPKYAFDAGYRGSDQAWLSMHFAPHLDRAAHGIKWPDISSYPLQAKMQGLSQHNRIVFFHGRDKPWMALPQTQSKWITRFYTQEG